MFGAELHEVYGGVDWVHRACLEVLGVEDCERDWRGGGVDGYEELVCWGEFVGVWVED